ncbi:3-phosphoinositide dependent kinase [Raphidocelis subcapitata]|uniref:non-specific serine/threonine protein kinase n=1 Tax=Raphidocelis subcapitata TaxID=307507 RepID=A0A2V0PAR7_9CHLO|nr:3-phosphoinositide dependent kinase [Raphidocelis subcapitata]|eukprot:GBF94960.1 3-phosphoinositide dependent kinase [Raphidocelis subcapitata]
MATQTCVQNAPQREEETYHAPKLQLTVADFDVLRRLGEGSFSTVILARYRADGREYAVKMINKSLVVRNKVIDYIRNERTILDRLHHPGVAELHFTFQDADSLYMGLEYCPNGELYGQLEARGKLPRADAAQWAAEVVDILGYLRSKEVIHRDLKPENLLIDAAGHLKLIDFGSAKALFMPPTVRRSGNRATSFVGTAEYVSPEVLNNTGISYAADLWALGCIIYQMLAGRPPFKAASEYLTFQRITARDLEFPEDFDPTARHLIDALVQEDPAARLGAADLSDLRAHPFFAAVDWAAGARAAPAPALAPVARQTEEEAALDWELSSIFRASSGPVYYEYLPAGAPQRAS